MRQENALLRQKLDVLARRFFGKKSDDLVDKSFPYPIVPGTTSEVMASCESARRAVAEMRVVDIEWERQDAYLASLRDITERKRTEKQ